MKITWYGTASIKLETKKTELLIDPFVPFVGSKVKTKIEDYDGCTNILVSHGHFDHILDIPEIVHRNPFATVYCSQTPAETLMREGVPKENIVVICPSSTLTIGDFEINVFKGKHSKLELHRKEELMKPSNYVCVKNIYRITKLLSKYPENDETLFFEIHAEDNTISIAGSLCIDESVTYPTDSDLLILPYSGRKDNFPWGNKIVELLNPSKVMLHHFDVTFPPIAMPVDIEPFLDYYGDRAFTIKQGSTIEI